MITYYQCVKTTIYCKKNPKMIISSRKRLVSYVKISSIANNGMRQTFYMYSQYSFEGSSSIKVQAGETSCMSFGLGSLCPLNFLFASVRFPCFLACSSFVIISRFDLRRVFLAEISVCLSSNRVYFELPFDGSMATDVARLRLKFRCISFDTVLLS